MADRIVKKDNLIISLEETNDIEILHQMVTNIALHTASDPNIMQDFEGAYPFLKGWEFTVLSCYKDFISPSQITGFALVCLWPFPEDVTIEFMDRMVYVDDSDLGKVLLLAVNEDRSPTASTYLEEEMTLLINSRVTHLRSLA